MTKTQKKLWAGLIILAFLAPLGIVLPELFHSGGAWGEWGTDTLEKLLGFLPEGLKKYTGLWKAPVPDYNLGGEDASVTIQVVSYIVSALLGFGIIALVIFVISKYVVKHEK